ncbi:MAG: hypothetical protein ACRDGB_15875, partial [Candidatus Limnocylindria bacterium]
MASSRGLPPIQRGGAWTRTLARGARNRVVSTLAPLVSTGLRKLPFGRRITRFLLEQTWSRGNAEMLDRYLV